MIGISCSIQSAGVSKVEVVSTADDRNGIVRVIEQAQSIHSIMQTLTQSHESAHQEIYNSSSDKLSSMNSLRHTPPCAMKACERCLAQELPIHGIQRIVKMPHHPQST
jgi:hypothetical protein